MSCRLAHTIRRSVATQTALVAGLACLALPAWGQEPPDPREAKPERPTVATHAYAVAAGIVELEAGIQWQRPTSSTGLLSGPVLFKIGLGRRVQFDVAPGWLSAQRDGESLGGIGDIAVAVKWQIAEHLPVLADFAIQPTVKFATGSIQRGTGTGTTDVSILLISSRSIGPVSLDVNVGYTRRTGSGEYAPTDATLWTVSSGFPVAGRISWDAELFGYPRTRGVAGSSAIVAFLTGPTVEVRRSLVLDAGFVFNVTGYGGTAFYAGVTWNMGRLPGAYRPPAPSR
jgi:hypothetical protein